MMEQPVEMLDSEAEETPAEESIDTSIDSQVEDDDVTDSDNTSDEPEEEFVEVERNGKKYSVPKSLEGEFLMQSDYTKKTQSVAEERKAVEADREAIKADREAVENERKLNQSLLRLSAQREHLAATYQQLEQINLYELNESDPVKAQGVLIHKQQVANALQQVHGQLTQEQQKAAESEKQSFAKLAEKAASHLAKEIKGWQPENEVDKAITEYVFASGAKGPDLAKFIAKYPQFGVMAHKARQYDELMTKQSVPKEKPVPQDKPVTRITASQGTATKDPTKMSPDEFAKWRKNTISRRR